MLAVRLVAAKTATSLIDTTLDLQIDGSVNALQGLCVLFASGFSEDALEYAEQVIVVGRSCRCLLSPSFPSCSRRRNVVRPLLPLPLPKTGDADLAK